MPVVPTADLAARVAKRAADIAGSLLGLAALAVLLPLIAIAIVADTGRPVFFRQRRTGRRGRDFMMLKFEGR